MSRLPRILVLFVVFFLTPLLTGVDCIAGRSSDGTYTITIDHVGSGGGLVEDSDYLLTASIAQPVQDNTSAAGQVIQAGFWFASTKPFVKRKSSILLLVLPAIMSQAEK